MRIRKAVITAAGPAQRTLPLQTLVDRDGVEKTVLHIVLEQALAAKIEEVCVVVCPGDEPRYLQAAGDHASALRLVAQPKPLGYAHAIWCTREFVAGDPFLHMVGDHLYVSPGDATTQRIVSLAESEGCSVSGVQPTREHLLPLYGAVAGRPVAGRAGLYRIDTVMEKPSPTEAEQHLVVPGLRAGSYLCFFGVHAFTPTVMDLLHASMSENVRPTSFSAILAELARREQYLAAEDAGRRYNLGTRYGLLTSQMALALSGRDRAEVLAQLLELLADRELAGPRQ
ncbi:MAG TPA: sugar phosphate nucleotidyltransferase [Verrucomicrobiae bacterium]|nr:sugar phosphate nucleotidyltransferase [Verrucomicrobiae bacterium]